MIRTGQFLDGSLGRDKDDARFPPGDHFQGGGPFRRDFLVARIDLAMDQARRIQFPHGEVRIEIGELAAQAADIFPGCRKDDKRSPCLRPLFQGTQKSGFNRSCQAGDCDRAGSPFPHPNPFYDVLFFQ